MTSIILTFSMSLGLLAQAPAAGDGKEERAARLEFMRKTLATYESTRRGTGTRCFDSRPSRSSASTNPVGYTVDGGIFFWIGEDGRPEAAVQAFLMRGGNYWVHDFTSLAIVPIVADSSSAWSGTRRGAASSSSRSPDAPKPAETAEARLRQMRELAQAFSVSDDFREQGWQALRPMPKPFARYGKAGSALIDGAVFCFALGTDPEAYLILEARGRQGRPGVAIRLRPADILRAQGVVEGPGSLEPPQPQAVERDRTLLRPALPARGVNCR